MQPTDRGGNQEGWCRENPTRATSPWSSLSRFSPCWNAYASAPSRGTVDLHEVFNAVLYLLKSGCQWLMLPEGFPNWVTVYSYFAKWSAPDQDGVSALERALKNPLAWPARNRGATPRPAS